MSKRKPRYQAPEGSLRAALEQLPDVRRGQGLEHPLGGVLALAVCAVLCGARRQYKVEKVGAGIAGKTIRAALGLKRERGPSGPTVHRVFRHLDHAASDAGAG